MAMAMRSPSLAPSPSPLRRFGVASSVLHTETPLARIWRVETVAGRPAALKIYRRATMGSEAPGIDYLRAHAGHGAAEVYRANRVAVLMEWLDGPSLADLSQDGDTRRADETLADVARRLHSASSPQGQLPPLSRMFTLLETARPGHPDLRQAQEMAQALLTTQDRQVALHGDLHHGNVRFGPRGATAFDAKGLWGDPAFELANAFRHPDGQPLTSQRIIAARAALWATALETEPQRLLAWAAAKCAWSIVLRKRPEGADPEMGLLAALLEAAGRSGFRC